MPRKKKGRAVSGILVLDKPSGVTSNFALQKVKKLFYAQKAGHTGSLDPLASGVLPICLGESTKISAFLLDADKRYLATCQLGKVTTTGDSEGEILSIKPVPAYDAQDLITLLKRFEGTQDQIPPMYSALKYQGRPLYELARQGIEIERKARRITIYEITLIACGVDSMDIEVHCSKGTYIRTLCEDIGTALECGAHLTALRRLSSGPFTLEQSVTVDDLEHIHDNTFAHTEITDGFLLAEGSLPAEGSAWSLLDRLLIATDRAILDFPRVDLNPMQNDLIQQGQAVEAVLERSDEYYRLYFNNVLKALATKDDAGRLTPKRLFFL